MEMYGQDIGITAAYSRQHAFDNLQEIRKKREIRRQLEAEEANRNSSDKLMCRNLKSKHEDSIA